MIGRGVKMLVLRGLENGVTVVILLVALKTASSLSFGPALLMAHTQLLAQVFFFFFCIF